MQQCREGWHLVTEPEHQPPADNEPDEDDDQADDDTADRRVRSTRRRQDAPDLPRVPMEDRTVGRVFEGPDGRTYRPSMFLTLTLPSYGRVTAEGVPVNPAAYDYRRAALDALHFPKLVDRFWQNLRRCAGYQVQYFATIEPQRRLAPHLHAAMRGTIPRRIVRQVRAATYHQVWWPAHEHPVYEDQRLPVWTDQAGYVDPDTGAPLPTWDDALDALDTGPEAVPAHVVRFGDQDDMQGLLAGTDEADRAVRYLCKYLTKAIAHTTTATTTCRQLGPRTSTAWPKKSAGSPMAPHERVSVQLAGQEAKAWARMGDRRQVELALERGRVLLESLPYPDNIDNHFTVDPDKFDAMDCHRRVGEDAMATMNAHEVIRKSTAPDGSLRSPMRAAEAHTTLAVAAAREGDLDGAIEAGTTALEIPRQSVPSLLMVTGDLVVELRERYAKEPGATDYLDRIAALSTTSSP